MSVETLAIATIRRDGGTQSRVSIANKVVREYRDVLREGRKLPPVLVFRDRDGQLWLGDGFHRVEAHASVPLDEIEAEVREGELRDAVLFAAGANADHGMRRSAADKRRSVELVLADPEWRERSDRWVADTCRVHHQLVARVRRRLDDHPAEERVGKDGKRRAQPPQLDDHPVPSEETPQLDDHPVVQSFGPALSVAEVDALAYESEETRRPAVHIVNLDLDLRPRDRDVVAVRVGGSTLLCIYSPLPSEDAELPPTLGATLYLRDGRRVEHELREGGAWTAAPGCPAPKEVA